MPWLTWVRTWSTITGSLFATGLALITLFPLVARLAWVAWIASKWRLRLWLRRGSALGWGWGGGWGVIFRLVGRGVIF